MIIHIRLVNVNYLSVTKAEWFGRWPPRTGRRPARPGGTRPARQQQGKIAICDTGPVKLRYVWFAAGGAATSPCTPLLADPLRDWHRAVSAFDPDRIRWELPVAGVPGLAALRSRRPRSGTAIFDALMDQLPAR